MNPDSDDEPMEMTSARYQANLNAWYASMLERDKSVLTLASAGLVGVIAAIVSLATSEKVPSLNWLFFGVLAAIYFFSALVSTLGIFRDNSDLLLKIVRGEVVGDDSNVLRRKKDGASDALLLGVAFGVVMGVAAAASRL